MIGKDGMVLRQSDGLV